MIENTLALAIAIYLTIAGVGHIADGAEAEMYAAATSFEHATLTGE